MNIQLQLARFSGLVSVLGLLLGTLGFYGDAPELAMPAIALACAVWANYYLVAARGQKQVAAHVLTLLFLAWAGYFACKTGGFFSQGVWLLFLTPVLAAMHRDCKAFLIYTVLTLAFFAFLYLGPAWGPGQLNLNRFRMIYLVILFAGFTAGLALMLDQHRKDQATARAAGQAMDRVTREAEAAMAVKDRFLANMSHEIRNPMNGIIGMMHVLLDSELDKAQQKYAHIVYNSARALLTIVNDILDLSKIEAGKLELDIRPFDLEIAVADIVSLPALQARQKGIEFDHHIDADVPRLLKGDIGRIRQIILNLTGNAIKFTENGSVTLSITLKDDRPGRARLHFAVDDTGIGIQEEVLETLFEAFTQADASITKQYGGTGLGLSISRLLVEEMGGCIRAESIEMVGSTFWFELPLEKQRPAEAFIDLAAIPISQSRILVVSDAGGPAMSLAKALSENQIAYTRADNDSHALELLHQAHDNSAPFHVVIMEVQESDQYARSLGRTVKADTHLNLTRLILVTAVGQKGDARDFEKMGFSGFLSLPLEGTQLPDCIRAVFSLPDDRDPGPIITRFSLAENKKQCCRILVVDDMETNVMTARALIAKQGYKADAARDGAQAVEKITATSYDLVLMDCQMPVMDGYEASRRIRALEKEAGRDPVPIIAMTGNAFKKDREKCMDAGMDDFIAKPVEPEVLARKIYTHLESQPARPVPAATGKQEDAGTISSRTPDILGETPDQDDLPVFDRDKVSERFGHDADLVQVVVDAFFQEAPELFQRLEQAIARDDTEGVRACAHALKGSAANVNAERLRQTAYTLERMATQNDMSSASLLFDRMGSEFNEFMGAART